jgi:hypothetical protein
MIRRSRILTEYFHSPLRGPVKFECAPEGKTMALESRVSDWQPHNGSLESAYHCRHCGGVLDGFGFHYTCHLCGARYCFVHMSKHDRAHPRTAAEVLAP